MTLTDAGAVAVIVLVAGAAQSLSGFGFALISVPLLAVVLGPRHAVVLSTCLGLAVSGVLLARSHHRTRWPTARRLLIGAVFGMPIGLFLLLNLPQSTLRAIITVGVVVATVLIAARVDLPVHGVVGEGVAGVITGVLATATSMNGPPVVITLQAQGLEPVEFRATVSAVFVAIGLLSTALFAATGQIDSVVLAGVAIGLPAVAIGFLGGELLFRRADPAQFRRVVIGMLLASAAVSFATLLAG